MKTLRNVFAANIREIRQSKKISQEELAFMAGLHRTYISDIERSTRNVSIDNIEKIAAALCVEVCLLFDDSERKQER